MSTAKRVVQTGPLSVKMYCAIGMVAVAWAHLEEIVTLCLSRLLGADHIEFLTVSAQMPVKGRLDSIKALGTRKLPAEQAARLAALYDEAVHLSRERNKILHGAWLQGEQPDIGIRLTYRAHGRISADAPTISAQDIALIGDRINQLAMDLATMLAELGLYDPKDPMHAPRR
ncbi:hypothetical protein [Azospirillum doebereinerae]